MKNVTGRTTNIKTGTYGPSHDPYGYSEYSMNTTFSDGSEEIVIVHSGLVNWFLINGIQTYIIDSEAEREFETQIGMTVGEFIATVMRAKSRRLNKCWKCGSRKISGQRGFPGEYLYICDNCKNVVDSAFDISAII